MGMGHVPKILDKIPDIIYLTFDLAYITLGQYMRRIRSMHFSSYIFPTLSQCSTLQIGHYMYVTVV
jgi:hypothetical protein